MVTSYWDRRQEARACLLAAREAIDALERRLERYWEATTRDTGHQTYLRHEQERYLGQTRDEALREAAEAVEHLTDAVRAWWPDETYRGLPHD